MDKFREFIKEVQSINISTRICDKPEVISRKIIDYKPTYKYFYLDKGTITYKLNLTSESTIRSLYSDAKLSLVLLSKEQIKNASKLIESLDYNKLETSVLQFQHRINNCKSCESDKAVFKLTLEKNFICDIPFGATISNLFICNLYKEIHLKNSYISKLKIDIEILLDEKKECDEMSAKQEPNNIRKEFKDEAQLSDIDVQQNQYPKQEALHSKHYALAFIFDCLATGVDFTMYDSKKLELEAIGEKRVNGTISGNTFYKAFNRIMGERIDLKSEKDLISLAGDNWRKIIIDLSHEQEKVSKYIKEEVF